MKKANQIRKMLEEVLVGLKSDPKTLPAKYFYDDKGTKLFNRICSLDEYYITNTEIDILRTHVDEIVQAIGQQPVLFEFGSGASTKTEILLNHISDIVCYVPIDISAAYLDSSAARLQQKYPKLRVVSLLKDFSKKLNPVAIPNLNNKNQPIKELPNNVGFFPGSTIGNFNAEDALQFLRNAAYFLGSGCKLLIGVDTIKDASILENAYNDSLGVTSEFNLNILRRINNELRSDFDVNMFKHRAFYNEDLKRIEMHLVCAQSFSVALGEENISFIQGEAIHTEYSYKYTTEDFIALADKAGFRFINYWTDNKLYFNVFLFIYP